MTSRILVVDDLEPNIRLLSAMLTLEYYTVIPATSGEAAIELAHAHNPDVILLDVMMPGLDGFETCRRLKADAATRHIPVVMVTALDQREDRVRGLEVGADDFLTKPVDDVQLMARVKSLSRFKIVLDELRAREASGRKLGVIEGDGPQAEAGLGARVLIVDDNPKQAERVRRALEADQRPILMHEAAALGPAGQATVELMIVSAAARTFDGLRVCAQVRSQEATRALPILCVVDPDDRARAMRALEMGVNDLVSRPVDAEELAARVRTQVRRKRYADQLRASVETSLELAVTDQLTGLHNRRFMEQQLKALMTRAARGGPPVSVIITDMDHFKKVNDCFGHDAGDDVLRELSVRLASNFRPRDLVCRFGGEEFVVVMPETGMDDAAAIAERLRIAVESGPFRVSGGRESLNLTVSIGVATSEAPGDSPETILKRADEALYQAKANGRNRVMSGFVEAQNENTPREGRAIGSQTG